VLQGSLVPIQTPLQGKPLHTAEERLPAVLHGPHGNGTCSLSGSQNFQSPQAPPRDWLSASQSVTGSVKQFVNGSSKIRKRQHTVHLPAMGVWGRYMPEKSIWHFNKHAFKQKCLPQSLSRGNLYLQIGQHSGNSNLSRS